MLGGALGALSRYGVAQLMLTAFGRSFPYATLTVNVLGSFCMGYLTVYFMSKVNVDPMIRLFLLVGFMGAFTTFSTFSMDTLNLIESGFVTKAFLNILLNVTCSLTAVWLGVILAR
ncbi:fluoride efflux transporter CrcB [Leucothrix sargassi]|nr:fluoride efflux transporter CrcB [Leucothrix sargassi]